jgi:S1-C subfamily serine protease
MRVPQKKKTLEIGKDKPKPEGTLPPGPAIRRLRIHWQSFALVGSGVLIAFAVLLAYNAILSPQPRLTQRDVSTAIARAMASATPPPSVAARVYDAIWPSVVLINTHTEKDDQPDEGHGSGVVLDDRGTILTSLHVVQGADEIQVIFADGTESNADIQATEPERDIAVLRTLQPPQFLVPATLGSPGSLHIGDEAIVVGNPFGLRHSVTSGVISGLGRTFKLPSTEEPVTGLIQFDAAVNPGNSGGPLLNRDGEVVGIVTALVNPTEQDVFIGIGFAVPIDVAASAAGTPPY